MTFRWGNCGFEQEEKDFCSECCNGCCDNEVTDESALWDDLMVRLPCVYAKFKLKILNQLKEEVKRQENENETTNT